MRYLGIDFGTVWTKAAIYDLDEEELKPVSFGRPNCKACVLDQSYYAIPTVAFYSRDYMQPIVVGREAVNMRLFEPECFISNFKPGLSDEKNIYAYKDIVTYEEVVAAILEYVNQEALKQNDKMSFDGYVLTVPAETQMDGNRIKVMSAAAEKAGLGNVQFVHEPVAAGCYAMKQYLMENALEDGTIFLIYDFGGGTFDCSLLAYKDKQVVVLSSGGSGDDEQLGGIYIDAKIREDIIGTSGYVAMLQKNNTDKKNRQSLYKFLHEAPMQLKHELTFENESSYYDYELSEVKYEQLIEPTIDATISFMSSFVNAYHEVDETVSWKTISAVILVGGSSQIPFVEKKLNDFRRDKDYVFDLVTCSSSDGDKYVGMINAVSAGAAEYESLKPTVNELFDVAKKHIKAGEYQAGADILEQLDNPGALYEYGMQYYLGHLGRKRNYVKAKVLFEKSSSPEALFMLALMAFKGEGMCKDDDMAKLLLEGLGTLDDNPLLCEKKLFLEGIILGTVSQTDYKRVYSYEFIKNI